jgi:hypothetical protein
LSLISLTCRSAINDLKKQNGGPLCKTKAEYTKKHCHMDVQISVYPLENMPEYAFI